MIEHQPPAAI